jgi:hypothetical protein
MREFLDAIKKRGYALAMMVNRRSHNKIKQLAKAAALLGSSFIILLDSR